MAGQEDVHSAWKPRHNPWVVAFTVTLATFMEILDTAIANVAIPHIAGGLSASENEATWVLTSYLVANGVVLPISAWVSSRVGRKRFYMSCVALFTASSFLCGLAPTLSSLVFFRVLQGVGGGGLAPSEQAILADTFPPERRGMAFAMYGVAVVFAPAIGPTLGGWIVDHTTWRWIFYINVPVGIASMLLSSMIVEDPPWLREEKERARRAGIDWLGLGLLVVAFGSLQVVLDKGQENDWFSSRMIVVFTMATIICMLGAIVWEWAHPTPIVDIRLFRNRNFAMSMVLMFTLGGVLYASTVLIPLFLQTLMGYSAQSAGEVLSAGAVVTMVTMPLVGFLVSRVPAKYLVACGFAGLSWALFQMGNIDLDIAPRTAEMYRIYQGATLGFLFIPINTISYIGMRREQNNQVSALVNLARNVGGSVGISFLGTALARRSQTIQNLLVDRLGQSNPLLHDRLAQLQHAFARAGPAQALRRAWAALYGTVQQQATLVAYVRIIQELALACAIIAPLVLVLVKRNQPGAAAMAH